MKATFVEIPIQVNLGRDPAAAERVVQLWNTTSAVFTYMQSIGVPTDDADLVGLMLFARAKAIQSDQPFELVWLNLIASSSLKKAFESAFITQREFVRALSDALPSPEVDPDSVH